MANSPKSFVKYCLTQIKIRGLHGSHLPPPTGFLRGCDVLGYDFQPVLRRSCSVYRDFHGRLPNLIAPSSFAEKQLLFKFFAPLPLLAASDKLGSRRYANDISSERLTIPKVIWSSDGTTLPDNADIPPGRHWFKSNYGSGTNMPVDFPLSDDDRARLEERARNWATKTHNRRLALWWNETFKRQIYLEENLSEGGAFSADDWKFFFCNGKVALFQHDQDRQHNHVQTIYDRDGNHISKTLYYPGAPSKPLPDQIGEMVKIAEDLGQFFDFIRVDLFLLSNGIYLGELALVPNGCSIPIR